MNCTEWVLYIVALLSNWYHNKDTSLVQLLMGYMKATPDACIKYSRNVAILVIHNICVVFIYITNLQRKYNYLRYTWCFTKRAFSLLSVMGNWWIWNNSHRRELGDNRRGGYSTAISEQCGEVIDTVKVQMRILK